MPVGNVSVVDQQRVNQWLTDNGHDPSLGGIPFGSEPDGLTRYEGMRHDKALELAAEHGVELHFA